VLSPRYSNFSLFAHVRVSADAEIDFDEMLQIDVVGVRRGRTSFAFSLRRDAAPDLERAAVSVHGGALFSPRIVIEFPPPGFVFKRGVEPFVMLSVSEAQRPDTTHPPGATASARAYTHERLHSALLARSLAVCARGVSFLFLCLSVSLSLCLSVSVSLCLCVSVSLCLLLPVPSPH
jgi:hypothetical protein